MDIAVLHPGEMGAAVAAALTPLHRVLWCAAGRSPATRARAVAAHLEEARDLGEVARHAEVVISICPPAAAETVAADVLAAGFAGRYLDANAVSPTTARRIADAVRAAGGAPIDGGIVGPPPRTPGTTRLHLSGAQAEEVAGWFAGHLLEPVVLSEAVGDASALKASYAGWTKASAALLVAMRAHARAAGVEAALLAEWERSQPGLRERSEAALPRLLETAWRYDGEMAQIASSMDDHGLPPELHDGAASLYRRLARLADTGTDPAEVLDALVTDPAAEQRGDGRPAD